MDAEKSKKRKKVAHVLKSSIYSGAENVVLTIIRELKDEFEFVYIATDGSIREKLEEENVTYLLLKEFNRRNLNKAIQDFSPDIIHAHDFSATVMCGTLSGRFRLISHLHYDPPWSRKWNVKTVVYWIISHRVERILAVSENSYLRMVFSKKLFEKVEMVGNPVDGSIIRCLAQNFGSIQENEEDVTNLACDLLFVGRFVKQKNPQRFIRLVAALRDSSWNNIQAYMVGSGELELECKMLIQKLGLQSHVELKGFQENPYPYIKNAKILCMTSRWEGFGLVAVEANLLGVPVVSTDNAGCISIFGGDADEICRTDEEFLKRINFLHQSEQNYLVWKRRALERSKRFDNMNEYLKKIVKVYAEK